MKINLNGQLLTVQAEQEAALIGLLQGMIRGEYDKLDSAGRMLAKQGARYVLLKMERTARVKHGKEKALVFRPGARQDPCEHLLNMIRGGIQEALRHVEVCVQTDADSVTYLAVNIEGEGATGGQVVIDGNIGQRQDDGVKVS